MGFARRSVLYLLLFLFSMVVHAAEGSRVAVGSYDMVRVGSIKPLTFPRVHIYDRAGKLIDQEGWPEELERVKKGAGDAFCCVSDTPVPEGWVGPPPNCEIVTYGEDVFEHFRGLRDSEGDAMGYETLPSHEYLVVEYYADWCAPCAPARRALEAFFNTTASEDYVAVVIDFSKLGNAK